MILVIGGTGRRAGKAAKLFRPGRHPVRIMTRSLWRAAAPRSTGADAVTTDLRHPDTLPAAQRGADAVVCTAHGSWLTRNLPDLKAEWQATAGRSRQRPTGSSGEYRPQGVSREGDDITVWGPGSGNRRRNGVPAKGKTEAITAEPAGHPVPRRAVLVGPLAAGMLAWASRLAGPAAAETSGDQGGSGGLPNVQVSRDGFTMHAEPSLAANPRDPRNLLAA